jgi:hypothetical protein
MRWSLEEEPWMHGCASGFGRSDTGIGPQSLSGFLNDTYETMPFHGLIRDVEADHRHV